MLENNKKDQKMESPKKDKNNFDIYSKEIKNINNSSSPKLDIKYEHQINDLFTSPISKKIQIHENESINKSYDKNKNIKNESNIYSPYVKRIDINGNKPDIKKYTTFKIGGKIDEVFFPDNTEAFKLLLDQNPEIEVYGNLSNTLISSDGYKGKIILYTKS